MAGARKWQTRSGGAGGWRSGAGHGMAAEGSTQDLLSQNQP